MKEERLLSISFRLECCQLALFGKFDRNPGKERNEYSCNMSSEDAPEVAEAAPASHDDPESVISYTSAAKYWEGVSPTVEGMLGGFGKISPIGKSTNYRSVIFEMLN